jgi:hypothetical protein
MFGDEAATIYKGTDAVTLTPLGVRFIEACIAGAKKSAT